MNLPGNRILRRRFHFTASLACLLCAFLNVPGHAQSEIVILPGERMVRADKGEPAMHRKVVEHIFNQSGYYRIYGRVWYNSGDAQKNESYFMDLRRNDGLTATPIDTNVAGPYRVVPDDPGPPHYAWRDCGLFHISAGRYALWLHHYALIAYLYPQYMNGIITPDIPESVRLTDSLRIVFYPSTDGAVSVTAITQQKKLYQGNLCDIVESGGQYQYRVTVRNIGTNPLIAPILKNELPEGVLADQFNLSPTFQDDRHLEWRLPDIAVNDSLVILFNATALRHFQPGFTLLADQAQLIAPDDVDISSNTSTAVVYGFNEPITDHQADVQISLTAKTDSTAMINGQPVPIAKPNGKIEYTIQVQNNGPDAADAMFFHQLLPKSFILDGASRSFNRMSTDSLVWFNELVSVGSPITVVVWGHVDPLIPVQDSILFSSVGAMSVTPDAFPNNNHDKAVVHVSITGPRPTKGSYDLALFHHALTDTSIWLNGKREAAVHAGQNFSYQLTIHNYGPQVAKDILLYLTVPDSVTILNSSLSPTRQKQDSLFWKIDSLVDKFSIQILCTAATAKTFPSYPYALLSRSRIDSPDDTLLVNNFGQATVYAIKPFVPPPPASKNFDLALQYQAVTDTSVTINGQKKQSGARSNQTLCGAGRQELFVSDHGTEQRPANRQKHQPVGYGAGLGQDHFYHSVHAEKRHPVLDRGFPAC